MGSFKYYHPSTMKIVYAFRKTDWFPFHKPGHRNLLPKDVRSGFLDEVKDAGFDGIELGVDGSLPSVDDEGAIKELRSELEDRGLPCLALRGVGSLVCPKLGEQNRERMREIIRTAAALGAEYINSTTGASQMGRTGPGTGTGESFSIGSSREARDSDYEHSAKAYAEAADFAADHGIALAIEMHQHSITDNSWSLGRLIDLVDRPNFTANPDLGNLYWTYNHPEESCEDAIVALAAHTRYWHCKNLTRVYLPDSDRAIFLQVPLQDGDIDYRFALSALHREGFDGLIAIEGVRTGDQLTRDRTSVEYVRRLWKELKCK